MQRRGGRAPSGHLSRLKPVEIDPLAEYGLPSKGEKRLLLFKNQESYYAKIAERYLAFCTDAGDRDGLQRQFALLSINNTPTPPPAPAPAPAPAPTPATSNTPPTASSTNPSTTSPSPPSKPQSQAQQPQLAQILSALRKLREGIVASKRHDEFASQAYLFAIRLGILASSPETYHPALLYLLRVLHPARNLTTVELHEATSYLVLDAACRRGDLAEAYALRNRYRVRDAKVDWVLRALVRDDWVLWRRVKRSVDGHRARIMDFAEAGVRAHVLKAFGRAYLSVDKDVLERQAGAEWRELVERNGVGWELSGGRVVIRKIHGRS
ncbi:hypothetical protein B0T22DRAFT_457640 [Podospora appendiculata]|uniref:CSN8/PSMD8/EIF3K domain-containing protein n=1 Tax=Podospora appendiculata TaxID=314037 RepID=A0AAE1CBL5_9PEZI|nr:hypothetical protein B0T22DRAFT_457640 [Podospora appendiculata]